MIRPVVHIDVDGVLADTEPPCKTFLGHHYDPHAWDFGTAKAGPEVASEFWRFFGEPGFCFLLPTYPGAREFVDSVRENYEVHFATTPFNCPTWVPERIEWLKTHMGATAKEITFTHRKDLLGGYALVDDKPDNHSKSQFFSFLLDRPYNRPETGDRRWGNENVCLIRVENYDQILEVLGCK